MARPSDYLHLFRNGQMDRDKRIIAEADGSAVPRKQTTKQHFMQAAVHHRTNELDLEDMDPPNTN